MPDPEAAPAVPETTGAAPAPESRQGQAGGSPPAEASPTSGGDGQETQADKALRRRLTEQAEELKDVKEILGAAMRTKAWSSVSAEITGNPTEEGPDPDIRIFGEDPATLAAGKAWKAAIVKEARDAAIREMRPVAQEFAATKEDRAIQKALRAEGLVPGEAFESFKGDFEAENPSYRKLRSVDAEAAARWLASSYSISQKRSGRQPAGDRAETVLERGGGSPAGVGSAASLVKIARDDPEKIHKMLAAIEKGETPVDEHGNPYRIPRQ